MFTCLYKVCGDDVRLLYRASNAHKLVTDLISKFWWGCIKHLYWVGESVQPDKKREFLRAFILSKHFFIFYVLILSPSIIEEKLDL